MMIMVLLGACGASIDTRLTINDNSSGCREIICTIENRELENFVYGGADGLELLIRQNIPQEMSYKMTREEKNTVLQFFIEFESAAEYKSKISKLLKRESSSVIAIRDNLFLKGIHVYEDFNSRDLLAWLSQALVENGVFKDDGSITVNEQSRKLVVGEEEKVPVPREDGHIVYSDIEDNGADSVNVVTNYNDGQYTREITLSFRTGTVELLGSKEIEKYISKSCGSKVSKTEEAGNTLFSVAIKGDSLESVAKKTAALIGGDTITYSNNYRPDFNMDITCYETLDFSNILSVTGTSNISMTLPSASEARLDRELSGGLSLQNNGDGTFTISGYCKVQPTIAYTYTGKASIPRIEINTDLSKRGRFSRSIKFYIPADQHDFYRTEYQSIFKSKKIDDQVTAFGSILEDYYVYTWMFSADSIKDFNMYTTDLFKGSEDFSYKKIISGGKVKFAINDNISFRRLFPDMENCSIQYVLIPPPNAKGIESIKEGSNEIDLEYDEKTGYYKGRLDSDEITVNGQIEFRNYVLLVYSLLIFAALAIIIAIFVRRIRKHKAGTAVNPAGEQGAESSMS